MITNIGTNCYQMSLDMIHWEGCDITSVLLLRDVDNLSTQEKAWCKPKLRNTLQNNESVFSKNVKIKKFWNARECSRLKENKELIHAMHVLPQWVHLIFSPNAFKKLQPEGQPADPLPACRVKSLPRILWKANGIFDYNGNRMLDRDCIILIHKIN